MAVQIQVKRDTAANWAANDPTPALAELCYESDTRLMKIGNGVDSYTALPYWPAASAASIVPDVASLTALDDNTLDDGFASAVLTLRDTFSLDKGSTLPIDGIAVVATLSGTGRWLRDLSPDVSWSSQATWFIDAVTGDDENDGLTAPTALATFSEFRRRVEKNGVGVAMSVVILTDLPSSDVVKVDSFGAQLTIEGVPTVVYSGTVVTFTRNPATNDIGTLNDAGWTIASYLWDHIRFTSGAASGLACWVAEDLGANSARVTGISNQSYTYGGTGATVPAPGDTFDVETMPTVTFGDTHYKGTLWLGNLYQADFATSFGHMLAPTTLNVLACRLTARFYPTGYMTTVDMLTNAFIGTQLWYSYGGAFAYLYAGAGQVSFFGPNATFDAALPTALNHSTTITENCNFRIYSDAYFYGNHGAFVFNMHAFSSMYIGSAARLRGICTATVLVTMDASVNLYRANADNTVTQTAVTLSSLGQNVDLNDTFFEPSSNTRMGTVIPTVSAIAADLTLLPDNVLEDGTQRFVLALKDTFRLDKSSTETVDGVTVVATASGTGRWIRKLIDGTAYGEISLATPTPQAGIPVTPNPPVAVTSFDTNGLSLRTTPDQSNNRIDIVDTGVYKVDFSISFGGTINETFRYHIAVNGVIQVNGGLERKLGTGGDVGSAMTNCILALSAGDQVSVLVDALTGPGTATANVQHANLNLHRLS